MSSELSMISIAVGSKNPVKVNASNAGALKALNNESISVAVQITTQGFNVGSGVSDQPIGDIETKLGAINRAKASYEEYFKVHLVMNK
jgi:non-canonical (house-cleaning) NTP pyrophosphatase